MFRFVHGCCSPVLLKYNNEQEARQESSLGKRWCHKRERYKLAWGACVRFPALYYATNPILQSAFWTLPLVKLETATFPVSLEDIRCTNSSVFIIKPTEFPSGQCFRRSTGGVQKENWQAGGAQSVYNDRSPVPMMGGVCNLAQASQASGDTP